jgi:hypothetical protein
MDAKTPPPDNKLASKMIPALAAYLKRIGAEEVSFRRFAVQEDHGDRYPSSKVIKIDVDGNLHAECEEHAPTPEEAKAIREEFLKIKEKLPTSIGATKTQFANLKRRLEGSSSITPSSSSTSTAL